MASTLLPSAGDQENRMFHGHIKAKSFGKLGYNASSNKTAFATPQKQLVLGNKAVHQSLGRSFGDISNRLNDRSTVTTPALKKTGAERTFTISDGEREFFPVITEVEDYSDILPPSLVLDDVAIQRLIHPWLMMQACKSERNLCNSTVPTPGHGHKDLLELDVLPMMRDAGGYLLKPVFEDPVPNILVD